MSAAIPSNAEFQGWTASKGGNQTGDGQVFQDALNDSKQALGISARASSITSQPSSSSQPSPVSTTLNNNNFETKDYSVYLSSTATASLPNGIIADPDGHPNPNGQQLKLGNIAIYNNSTGDSLKIYGFQLGQIEGSESAAQKNVLQINLSDGTQVSIAPSLQKVPTKDGTTNIGAVAVTKDGQTAFYNGFDTGYITHTQFQPGTAADLDPTRFGGPTLVESAGSDGLTPVGLTLPASGSVPAA